MNLQETRGPGEAPAGRLLFQALHQDWVVAVQLYSQAEAAEMHVQGPAFPHPARHQAERAGA